MIYGTVGTMYLDFGRLIRALDDIARDTGERVVIQTGLSATLPRDAEHFDFKSREDVIELQREARVIVCHAGIGSVIDALKAGKPLITVPRLKRFGEHNNDHQLDIVEAVERRGWGRGVANMDELAEACASPPEPKGDYLPDRSRLIRSVRDTILGSVVLMLASFAQPGEAQEPRQAYFGDLHIHTGWSADAYVNGTRTTPEQAYRFGRGETIALGGGVTVRPERPLDFMAVTDHSEYLGVFAKMGDPSHALSKHPLAPEFNSGDSARMVLAYLRIAPRPDLYSKEIMPADRSLHNQETAAAMWAEMVAVAEAYNAPGEFTTFAAYEWSSSQGGRNRHRNIIFGFSKAIPSRPFTAFESGEPEALWKWMEKHRARGARLLAIPHNANWSRGMRYSMKDSYGNPIDRAYAEMRSRNEPLEEIIQLKNQSMAHPVLFPEDEFAGFEWYRKRDAEGEAVQPLPGSYARIGLQRGLAAEASLGSNPFKFGVIGSSDMHRLKNSYSENLFQNPDGPWTVWLERWRAEGFTDRELQMSSGALAGVWAEENTRASIYDALVRRETFATSGPRIRVRLFAGWDFAGAYEDADAMASDGYKRGVPMGADMRPRVGETSPVLLVWAAKDPMSANLNRIQIIKGFLKEGQTGEAIYDVALSDGRQPNPDGSVPENGATVDLETGAYSEDVGALELFGVWRDPNFDPSQRAYYFARVTENPTPRRSTLMAIKAGIPISEQVPATIRERAWSSPIWYSPAGDED